MQKNIYGCTDYILAGAKTGCAAGRLNCYFKADNIVILIAKCFSLCYPFVDNTRMEW